MPFPTMVRQWLYPGAQAGGDRLGRAAWTLLASTILNLDQTLVKD